MLDILVEFLWYAIVGMAGTFIILCVLSAFRETGSDRRHEDNRSGVEHKRSLKMTKIEAIAIVHQEAAKHTGNVRKALLVCAEAAKADVERNWKRKQKSMEGERNDH